MTTADERFDDQLDLHQLSGTTFEGRYELIEPLGEGAMGVVYRARQNSINRDVAVKICKLDRLNVDSKDSVQLDRLHREVELISSFEHPNICRLVDFGEQPDWGIFYTVMELIDGPTLRSLAKNKRTHISFALEVIDQLLAALSEPHSRGVVHRDLKPDNIMLRALPDGSLQVKLVDFGIARPIKAGAKLTVSGTILGTPAYMSPEQAESRPVDPRTDLYAVGVIFFELLTGMPPFKANNAMGMMFKHSRKKPPTIGSVVPEYSNTALEALVSRLLEKHQELRPANVKEVRRHISSIRMEMGIHPFELDMTLPIEDIFEPWIGENSLIPRDNAPTTPSGARAVHPNSLYESLDSTERSLEEGFTPESFIGRIQPREFKHTPLTLHDKPSGLEALRAPTMEESWDEASSQVDSLEYLSAPSSPHSSNADSKATLSFSNSDKLLQAISNPELSDSSSDTFEEDDLTTQSDPLPTSEDSEKSTTHFQRTTDEDRKPTTHFQKDVLEEKETTSFDRDDSPKEEPRLAKTPDAKKIEPVERKELLMQDKHHKDNAVQNKLIIALVFLVLILLGTIVGMLLMRPPPPHHFHPPEDVENR